MVLDTRSTRGEAALAGPEASVAEPLPSWRDLAAQLKALGLPRGKHDTRATMAALIRSAEKRSLRRGRLAAEPAPRIVPALHGPPAALEALAGAIGRMGGRRVAPDTALVPARRLGALRRAARRAGHTILPAAQPNVPCSETEPAVWAAAQLVRDLHALFGWPAALLPPELATLPAPLDRAGARQAEAYRRAWLGALEAQIDPAAEGTAEPAGTEPPPPAACCREIVLRALREGRVLQIRYRAPNGTTQRTVEPRALETRHGRSYLLAFCHLRQAERLFRLDRIVAAEVDE